MLHLDRLAFQVLASCSCFLVLSAILNLAVAGTLAQRRQFKEALAESEALHRLMIADNATADIIVRYDADGRVVLYASPSVRQLRLRAGGRDRTQHGRIRPSRTIRRRAAKSPTRSRRQEDVRSS